MKVVIHQSLCGENNKGWDLLKTTMSDLTLAKSVAFKTDLQEQTGDINWIPAIRGFADGDYFLIMKTFEDRSLDVRRGRKFSHVLMINKGDMINIENLAPIFDLLPKEIDKDVLIKPITLEFASNPTGIDLRSEIFLGRFRKLIHGYLNIHDYANTIIWCGQQDFDLAVIELWRRLDPPERQNLNFGILFNNDGIRNEKINLIAIPENIQSRFLKSGFLIINQDDQHAATEIVEQIFIGDPAASNRIEIFKNITEAKFLTRNDISLVAKGINTFEQLAMVNDLKKINTLSHIIARFSPAEYQGEEYKSRLVNKIIELMSSESYSDLIVLRAFKTESFKGSQQKLTKALHNWIDSHILAVKGKFNEYIKFFSRLAVSNFNWWDKTIENSLSSFLKQLDVTRASTVYLWLTEEPAILKIIDKYLDQSPAGESCFLEKLPKKVSLHLFEQLKSFCIKAKWLRLYAQVLNQQYDFTIALTELLKIDQDKDHFDALNLIVKDVQSKSVVDFAIENGDSRIIKKAGILAHESPVLLNDMDVLNPQWQNIWLEAIYNGNKIHSGLTDPTNQINKIFDGTIAEIPVSEELLKKISASDYGNLLSYPHRATLWLKLPSSTKDHFLAKTSAALLEQLSKNSTTSVPDDQVLAEYISRTGISDFLYFNKDNIKSVIPIVERFSISDDNLTVYIDNYSGPINAIEATQLGKLIGNKRYTDSAYAINRRASRDNNWRFGLAECHHILDLISKGLLLVSGIISTVSIPTDQWWQGAEELIVELYPNGTSLTTVWKKAGGKESDLIMNTTASIVWHDLLHRLRNNNFQKVTMNSLLKEINKQYEQNEKFNIIYNLRKNYIKAS